MAVSYNVQAEVIDLRSDGPDPEKPFSWTPMCGIG